MHWICYDASSVNGKVHFIIFNEKQGIHSVSLMILRLFTRIEVNVISCFNYLQSYFFFRKGRHSVAIGSSKEHQMAIYLNDLNLIKHWVQEIHISMINSNIYKKKTKLAKNKRNLLTYFTNLSCRCSSKN